MGGEHAQQLGQAVLQAHQAGAQQQHDGGAGAAAPALIRQGGFFALQLGQADGFDASAVSGQSNQAGFDQRAPGAVPFFKQQVQPRARQKVGAVDPLGQAGVEVSHGLKEAAAHAVAGLAVQVQPRGAGGGVVQPHPGSAGQAAGVFDEWGRACAGRHLTHARAAEVGTQVRRKSARAFVDGAFDKARADGVQQVLPPRPGIAAQVSQALGLQGGGLHQGGGDGVGLVLLAGLLGVASEHIERDGGEGAGRAGLARGVPGFDRLSLNGWG